VREPSRPPAPRTFDEVDALWLAALLVFVASRCLVPMDETDLFFNLRLGDLIRATKTVPRTNLLSFTYPDARDINLAWLFQVVLSWCYAHAGIAGTIVLKTSAVLVSWTALFFAARRSGAHPGAVALCLALGAWAAEPRFVERPHLVTFLGLGLLALAVADLERGRPWRLGWLVPWGLLWANGNSCFAWAPLLLLLYAAGAHLDRARAARSWALRAAAIFAPLVLANPSGVWTLVYLGRHWTMPWLRPLQEYRVASWPLDAPFVFVLVALVAAASTRAWTRRQAGRPFAGWRLLLPCACMAFLAWRRIRFVAELAMLAPVVTASWLGPWMTRAPGAKGTGRAWAVAAVLLALVPKLAAHEPGHPWLDLRLEDHLVPTAAIAFLDAHDLRSGLYHDMEVGSYLTWDEAAAGRPSHPVFQDPRINGYPPAFHAVLRRDDLGTETWQTFLARWNVSSALLTFPSENPRAAWFPPERWALVFRDAEALVFVRRDRLERSGLARLEIPLTFRKEPAPDGRLVPHLLDQRPGTLAPCLWHQHRGDFALERGDEHQALAAYDEALASDQVTAGAACLGAGERAALRTTAALLALESHAPAHALLLLGDASDDDAENLRGLASSALGRWSEAEASFVRVLAHRPEQADALFGSGLAREMRGDRSGARAQFAKLLRVAPSHPGAAHARRASAEP